MSYVNDEGEKSFDITDFAQFIPFGIGGKVVSAPLANIEKGLTRDAIDALSKLSRDVSAVPRTGILESIGNLFKKPIVKTGVGASGAGALAGTSSLIPKFEIGGKAAVTGTVVAASGLASLITLTQTQGGKDFGKSVTDTTGNLTDIGKDFSTFIRQNGQLFSIFLIIAGAAIVIGAVKSK